MRGLKLDHLQTFHDVVELGSFSGAAERLGLTQPAVSLQIRQLERRLGVQLIERIARRATPTAAGLALLDHIRRIETAVDDAVEAMAEHARGTTGRVRLGTGATACIYLLPPTLRALRAKFPGLGIVVTTGSSQAIIKAVEDNTVDVALVTGPVSGRSLDVTPVMRDEFVAVFAPGHAPVRSAMTAEMMNRRPLVLYEPGSNTRRLVDHWFQRAERSPAPVMELGSVDAIKEMVAAGLGCSILPRMAVAAVDRNPQLVVRTLSPRLHRTLAIVIRRDKRLNRGLQRVIEALRGLTG
jgi:DNA-binding transcriptional LysR family regulator